MDTRSIHTIVGLPVDIGYGIPISVGNACYCVTAEFHPPYVCDCGDVIPAEVIDVEIVDLTVDGKPFNPNDLSDGDRQRLISEGMRVVYDEADHLAPREYQEEVCCDY